MIPVNLSALKEVELSFSDSNSKSNYQQINDLKCIFVFEDEYPLTL